MRRTDTRLTRQVGLALAVTLVMALVFTVAVSAKPAEPSAPDLPLPPHCFYGTVIGGGTPLPGVTVTAKAVAGYWTGQLTTTADAQGRYGWDGAFCVPGFNSGAETGAKPGDQIGFYVNGVQASLFDVRTGRTSSTYPFVNFGDTELNLLVPVAGGPTIDATAGAGGTINPSGPIKVSSGGNQAFTFTPDPGYKILDVLVDGASNPQAVAAGAYTFTNVTQDHTIHVSFARATYLITPTASAGCTITPATPQVVDYQGSVTFTVAANPGYNLVDVKVDGASKGPIASFAFTNVDADHTIAAVCVKQGLTHKIFLPFVTR